MNQRFLLFSLVTILLIWGVVAAVFNTTGDHASSPQKVLKLMNASPWLHSRPTGDADRQQHLGKIIAQINRLDFDQRRELRQHEQESTRPFFDSLTEAEKNRFLQETVEAHFKSVMKAFNQMSQEERRRLVQQARNDLRRNRAEGQNMEQLHQQDDAAFKTMVDKGLSAYYQEASVETKMDLAPYLEEMQQRLRGFSNR